MDDPRVSQSMNSPLRPIAPGKPSSSATKGSEIPAKSGTETGVIKGKQVSTADVASVGESAIATLSELLPMEILSSPGLRRAEWAWRQLLTENLAKWAVARSSFPQTQTQMSGHASNGADQGALSLMRQASENTMYSWWNVLSAWTNSARQNKLFPGNARNDVRLLQWVQSEGGLLPFAHMTKADYSRLSAPLRHEVLLDRVIGTVTAENAPYMGSGVFVPPGEQGDTHEPVHWSAERTARLNRHGQMVHRLSLQFSLHDWPVEIVLLSTKPSLYVHVRSDHPNVRKMAATAEPLLLRKLRADGWELQQWSISGWAEEEYEE